MLGRAACSLMGGFSHSLARLLSLVSRGGAAILEPSRSQTHLASRYQHLARLRLLRSGRAWRGHRDCSDPQMGHKGIGDGRN